MEVSRHPSTMRAKIILFECFILWLMSRMGGGVAAKRCSAPQLSVFGKMLKDHVVTAFNATTPDECFMKCKEEPRRCQSFNYVIHQRICELNNRTKDARPEKFVADQNRFYMKAGSGRGMYRFF